jgi:uncharacterized protein
MMKRNLVLFLSGLFAILIFTAEITAQQRTLRGRLAPTVEAGGWLIVEANNQKFLLLNADKFRNESWFREGAEVTATGEVKKDVMTIYQEGTPFEARTLQPSQNSSGGNQPAVNRLTTATVAGDARVTAQPDTGIISISVVTQNRSATEAQQQNAAQTTAVINALKRAAGAGAEIKTSGYALIPQRLYRENQPPTITGYEARNSITVTLSDLTRVGAVIDAAAQAGANNIDGIAFTLRRDQEARGRALAEATRAAINKANMLAQTLGGRVVRIIAVEEGGAPVRPLVYARQEAMMARGGAVDTPIEVGALEINSEVRLIAEIEIAGNLR